MERSELEALIQLLEDPDEQIYEQIQTKFVQIGPQVIDDLEEVWESTVDTHHRNNIERVIHAIQRNNLVEKFSLWLKAGGKDLIQGATLVARINYPDLRVAEMKAKIETIKDVIWLELNDNLTPLEKINVFNQVFYGEFRFGGKLEEVFDPTNNYINRVLERKKGSPFMVGIIYLAIAQELELPVFGVELPYHFALAFCKYIRNENNELIATNNKQVVFYINPISKGILFHKNEIKDYLKRVKVEAEDKYYNPIENKRCIYALMKHLRACFEKEKETEKLDRLDELVNLFNF